VVLLELELEQELVPLLLKLKNKKTYIEKKSV
jgi:hypothetical protein